MLDLVLWSGSLALTPLALGLTWRLISGGVGRIAPATPAERAAMETDDIDRGAAGRSARAAAQEKGPCSPTAWQRP